MLVVETIARIRREYFVKGKSIKEIVRDLTTRLSSSFAANAAARFLQSRYRRQWRQSVQGERPSSPPVILTTSGS
jgi:hypothetical protein